MHHSRCLKHSNSSNVVFQYSETRSPKRQLAHKKKVRSASSLNLTISKRPPIPPPYHTDHLTNPGTGSLPTAYKSDKMYETIRERIRPRSAIVEISNGKKYFTGNNDWQIIMQHLYIIVMRNVADIFTQKPKGCRPKG